MTTVTAHSRNRRLELAFGIHKEQSAADDMFALLQARLDFPPVVGAGADFDLARFKVVVFD